MLDCKSTITGSNPVGASSPVSRLRSPNVFNSNTLRRALCVSWEYFAYRSHGPGRDAVFPVLRGTELGIDNNTIVFFTSDNGGYRLAEEFFHGNGGLRGGKGEFYEGGLRVPLVIRWPGRVAAGKTDDLVCAFWDVMPTLAELAGAEVPRGDRRRLLCCPTPAPAAGNPGSLSVLGKAASEQRRSTTMVGRRAKRQMEGRSQQASSSPRVVRFELRCW